MKVLSVTVETDAISLKQTETVSILSEDLDGEQYARLRLLLDETTILQSIHPNVGQTEADSTKNVRVTVLTSEGTVEASYSDSNLPVDVLELREFLRDVASILYWPGAGAQAGIHIVKLDDRQRDERLSA